MIRSTSLPVTLLIMQTEAFAMGGFLLRDLILWALAVGLGMPNYLFRHKQPIGP